MAKIIKQSVIIIIQLIVISWIPFLNVFAQKQTISVEKYLHQIANSPRGSSWELQHYDTEIRFPTKQLINHLRKIEARVLKAGIKDDDDFERNKPMIWELDNVLEIMSHNPSPELIPELKRVIQCSQLPSYIRGTAARVYGVLGGDSQFLRELIENKDDYLRSQAIAALGLQLYLLPDEKPLKDFADQMKEKVRKSETGKGPYLGARTSNMIYEIVGIPNYRHYLEKSSLDFRSRLCGLFDNIYLETAEDAGEAGFISTQPAVLIRVRVLHELIDQNGTRAIQILQEHIRNKEPYDQLRGWYLMYLLNLPLEKDAEAKVNNYLKRFGSSIPEPKNLTLPGLPIFASLKKNQ